MFQKENGDSGQPIFLSVLTAYRSLGSREQSADLRALPSCYVYTSNIVMKLPCFFFNKWLVIYFINILDSNLAFYIRDIKQ